MFHNVCGFRILIMMTQEPQSKVTCTVFENDGKWSHFLFLTAKHSSQRIPSSVLKYFPCKGMSHLVGNVKLRTECQTYKGMSHLVGFVKLIGNVTPARKCQIMKGMSNL